MTMKKRVECLTLPFELTISLVPALNAGDQEPRGLLQRFRLQPPIEASLPSGMEWWQVEAGYQTFTSKMLDCIAADRSNMLAVGRALLLDRMIGTSMLHGLLVEISIAMARNNDLWNVRKLMMDVLGKGFVSATAEHLDLQPINTFYPRT